MAYITLREARRLTGLCGNTLRTYADNGKIKSIRMPSGQRRFDLSSFLGEEEKISPVVCYCRVSSAKQKDDLSRQVVFMREHYPNAEIVQDIGSGLNFKRKGLRALLERAMRGTKLSVVVAHRDRLARFGFEIIEQVIQAFGGEILVLDRTEHSPERELSEDILAILLVFSCRMHGLRRYHDKIQEDPNLSDSPPAGAV